MLATKLSKVIVAPNRVASVLDWKKIGGTVLSLDIDNERIGMALSEHPSQNNIIYQLETIRIERYVDSNDRLAVDKRIVDELEEIVKKHKVSAFIVGWPLQPEGRMGAPCGKVLHTLDSLVDQSNRIITKSRPIAFLDDRGNQSAQPDHSPPKKEEEIPDVWGRSPVFAEAPDYVEGMEHRSKDQFLRPTSQDSSVAGSLLQTFLESNWEVDELRKVNASTPEYDEFVKEYGIDSVEPPARKMFKGKNSFTDEYEDDVYIQVGLL